jgi:two-component system NarL family sensor kinase
VGRTGDSESIVGEDANRTAVTRDEARTVAIIRVALVIAIGVGALVDRRPAHYDPLFYVVLGVAALLAALAFVYPSGRGQSSYVFTGIHLVILTALAYSSGGAASEIRFAFFAIPVLTAMLLTPRATLMISIAMVLIYLSLALTRESDVVGRESDVYYVELVYLVWACVAALLLSRLMTRRAGRIAALVRARGRLMVDVLAAEDRERKRLADWLHDGAVQNLLVAGQDLAEAERGDRGALRRAREIVRETIPKLRSVLIDLHPGLLTSTGLGPALEALAEAQARHGAYGVDVSVDDAAPSDHDQLLLSLARELLINVGKHARAQHVRVSVRRQRRETVLEISDDGVGFDPARRAAALADGHIGLASSVERVETLGGRVDIMSAPGQGTRVLVTLPSPGES